jgi:hypothetical protein
VRLESIHLQNAGLIADLTIDLTPRDGSAGSVVMLRGKNGTGKTTIIRAIQTMFDGGSFPDLIGPNGDEYSVEIRFDNGDRFIRTENAKGYTLKGWNADGSVIKSPAKTLQQLASGLALDPTGLVDAPPKDKVKFLQDAMPLSFTRADLVRAGCGSCEGCAAGEPLDRSGKWHGSKPCTATDLRPVYDLPAFTSFRDGKYSRRREVNVEAKDLHATRRHVAQALPEGDVLRTARTGSGEANTAPAEPTAREEVAHAEAALQTARRKLNDSLTEWRGDYDRLKEDIAERERAAIEEARQLFEAACERIRNERNTERTELDVKYNETVAEYRKPLDEEIEHATIILGAARENLEQLNRLEGVRQSLASLDEKITAKDEEAVALDEQVKALDQLKIERLNSQPIPGVEIRDGEIYWRGLRFQTQVNLAQQYTLSFQVAALSIGEDALPFFLFDKAESIVGQDRLELFEGLKEAGFTVLVADADEQAEQLEVVTA